MPLRFVDAVKINLLTPRLLLSDLLANVLHQGRVLVLHNLAHLGQSSLHFLQLPASQPVSELDVLLHSLFLLNVELAAQHREGLELQQLDEVQLGGVVLLHVEFATVEGGLLD